MTLSEPAGQGCIDVVTPWITSAGIAWVIAVAGFVIVLAVLVIIASWESRR